MILSLFYTAYTQLMIHRIDKYTENQHLSLDRIFNI